MDVQRYIRSHSIEKQHPEFFLCLDYEDTKKFCPFTKTTYPLLTQMVFCSRLIDEMKTSGHLKCLCMVLAAMILFSFRTFSQGNPEMEQTALEFLRKKQPQWVPVNNCFDRKTQLGKSVVYEQLHPQMFVIAAEVQGHTRVIGYSLQNCFFPENDELTPVPVLAQCIEDNVNKPGRLKVTGKPEGAVGPLIRTHWGQSQFFNYFCPKDPRGPNGRVYAGCTAVAMGQIVRYYGPYNSFNFNHSYQSGFFGILNASIGQYNWSLMDEVQVAVNLEISDFLYDLGVLLHTTYSVSGSSANTHRTLEAFHELGYTGATLLRKSDFTPSSWEEELYRNLSQYKPIWVAGGGHAFICDGYDEEGYFHFNLGAAGYGDGFYPPGLVMGFPVSEAITELEPVSWPLRPVAVSRIIQGSEPCVSWKYLPDSRAERSRIYVDEQFLLETTDTLYPLGNLSPGIHAIHVSVVTPDGESLWIGPLEVFIMGTLVTIKDPEVYNAVKKALGYASSDTEMPLISQGDLGRIITLSMDLPVRNLEDIELCGRLKRLRVTGHPETGLDPGPLQYLPRLQVLEWCGQMAGDLTGLGGLVCLTELHLSGCPLDSWEFLRSITRLMKFSSVSARAPDPAPLSDLPFLNDINLSASGLEQAEFISGKTTLMSINLSDNSIRDAAFLDRLVDLRQLDLSHNQLTVMRLTDGLKSLATVNLENNRITSLIISGDLPSLARLDLSGNLLSSPGRLFLYTPALQELDLSDNRILGMGTYRCPNLETLDLTGNLIIGLDWPALHPGLKHLGLSHNRISDISGLSEMVQRRQLRYLSLTGNPLSKESFETNLPVFREILDSLYYPDTYEPYSPCYPTPADGDRFPGNRMKFSWHSPQTAENAVYDVFRLEGDSLILLKGDLVTNLVELEGKPAGSLRWAVAMRTSDSVYYSGIYQAYPVSLWDIPYFEGFEDFNVSEPLERQSDHWIVDGEVPGQSDAAIVGSSARNGSLSLEIRGTAVCRLPLDHLKLTTLTVRFSVLVPPGARGSCRIDNLNGLEIRIETDEAGQGRVYLNGKLSLDFPVETDRWTDYRLSANARNNQIFIWAGNRLIVNQPWLFPGGFVSLSCLGFNIHSAQNDTDPKYRLMLVDDVAIQSSSITGTEDAGSLPADILVYPNPCGDCFYVTVPENEVNLTIIDMTGRLVRSQILRMEPGRTARIEIQDLVDGFYLIRLRTQSGNSVTSRLLKAKA